MIVMNVTKLSYANPRPYWVSSDIIAYKCSNQFGNPSGHSMTTMAMALTLWLDYKETSNGSYGATRKAILLALAILFPISIGFSRLILGVHSLDQICYGLLLGVWIAMSMQYCVRPYLDTHITVLIKAKPTNFKYNLIVGGIVFSVIIGGQVLNYYLMSTRIVIDSNWVDNMVS